jgi:hypothetical protein
MQLKNILRRIHSNAARALAHLTESLGIHKSAFW